MEAADDIVCYLKKTENKLKGEMPDPVRKKIKQENEKAKVRKFELYNFSASYFISV